MRDALMVAMAMAGMLAACAPTGGISPVDPVGGYGHVGQVAAVPQTVAQAGPPLTSAQATRNFGAVVNRVEPVAEAYCRRAGTAGSCDFQILVDDQPGEPANAWQTVDSSGRPNITFTLALIADARNADELAFVMGHEAAHHIAGHIPLQQQSALAGAMLAGLVGAAAGLDTASVQQMTDLGAQVGAASYSKDYELQADAIGTEIAYAAGYDPMLGMGFFDRIPDPGDEFLGSHPANAQRKAVVAQVMAEISAR